MAFNENDQDGFSNACLLLANDWLMAANDWPPVETAEAEHRSGKRKHAEAQISNSKSVKYTTIDSTSVNKERIFDFEKFNFNFPISSKLLKGSLHAGLRSLKAIGLEWFS